MDEREGIKMAKQRLNQDDAFKSIMGKNVDNEEENEAIESDNEIIAIKEKPAEKLVQTAFYITEKQRKAIKMKVAIGERPEDKDQSSIIRAALDVYLADILEKSQ